MQAFDAGEALAGFNQDHVYLEPLIAESLSVGIAVWRAGTRDGQSPHEQDEVYCVLAGRGRIRVGEEDRGVVPGSVVFVGAQVPHYFHDVEEDLQVVVFWTPPHRGRETPKG
ncbi:MAG TPA: cupin domain-containing protein [Candidatus Dormibacteraeota bacterium]